MTTFFVLYIKIPIYKNKPIFLGFWSITTLSHLKPYLDEQGLHDGDR